MITQYQKNYRAVFDNKDEWWDARNKGLVPEHAKPITSSLMDSWIWEWTDWVTDSFDGCF